MKLIELLRKILRFVLSIFTKKKQTIKGSISHVEFIIPGDEK